MGDLAQPFPRQRVREVGIEIGEGHSRMGIFQNVWIGQGWISMDERSNQREIEVNAARSKFICAARPAKFGFDAPQDAELDLSGCQIAFSQRRRIEEIRLPA